MLEKALQKLRQVEELRERIVHWRTFPAREAITEDLPKGLDPRIVATLHGRGITSLYRHQRHAIDALRARRDTVIVTPTASGKSLCYNLPVLERLLNGREEGSKSPAPRALYLFPTKALSQDQVGELTALLDGVERAGAAGSGQRGRSLRAYTYDGDTPPATRRSLREDGDIVVTNPYMLHQGILPNHVKWISLFQGLELVVIDELHTYRGIFGSHVANVLRRLRRICRHYGSDPVFAATSATIANPQELAETLVGKPFFCVDKDLDGSPQGTRHFLFYNPPIVHAGVGLRAPAIEEVRRIAPLFLQAGVQAIYFLRTRTQVEILTKYLRDAAERAGVDESRVRGYRGGYLPLLRREIEAGLKSGDVLAVAATNALELGVDIGALDAAVLVGYPGSMASVWQQAGRAGRRQGESVVILCGRSDPLDQYIMRHPEHLFDRPSEAARIDPDNLVIRTAHLKCACFELPMEADESFGGSDQESENDTEELLEYLALDAGLLTRAAGPRVDRFHWMSEAYPAQGTSLQAADIDNFVIYDMDERRIFAEIDRPAALTEIHEGAIYGHQGEQYHVEQLDYDNRRALTRKVNVDYYTQAETDVALTVVFEDETSRYVGEADSPAYSAGVGQVHVSVSATIYKKLKFYTRENIGAGEIQLPPEEMETDSIWLVLSDEIAMGAGLHEGSGSRGLAALGNMLRNLLPLYLLCDRADLRVHTEIKSTHFGQPTIFLYEAAPGGVGLARRGHECHRRCLQSVLEVAQGCGCVDGCPACIGVPGGQGDPAKRAAVRLAQLMLRAGEPAPAAATAGTAGHSPT